MIAFTKAEGAQNDFVVIEDLDRLIAREARVALARVVCHRRRGVGGDGVIFIERSQIAGHDFAMAFHNPDGSDGSMCGNGGRAAALYAFSRGIAGADMRFDVLERAYRAEVRDEGIRLHFPAPTVIYTDMRLEAYVHGAAQVFPARFVHNGAPHVVLLLADLPAALAAPIDAVDLDAIGRALRNHPMFRPDGANVNIVDTSGDVLRIRTFEKGVEGETQACGTGTLAAGMMVHAATGASAPLALRTRGGDLLRVHFDADAQHPLHDPAHYATALALEGPARLVFEGRWDEVRGELAACPEPVAAGGAA